MTDPRIVKSESSSILKVKDGQTQEILSNFLREGETQMSHGLSHPRPDNGGSGGSTEMTLQSVSPSTVELGGTLDFVFSNWNIDNFDSVMLMPSGGGSGFGLSMTYSSDEPWLPAATMTVTGTVPSDQSAGDYTPTWIDGTGHFHDYSSTVRVTAPPPPLPTVDGITPTTAANAGGTTMTITGSGFSTGGIYSVLVYDPNYSPDIEQTPWQTISVSNSVQSDTELTFTAPPAIFTDGDQNDHNLTNSTAGVLLNRYIGGVGDQIVWHSNTAYTYE